MLSDLTRCNAIPLILERASKRRVHTQRSRPSRNLSKKPSLETRSFTPNVTIPKPLTYSSQINSTLRICFYTGWFCHSNWRLVVSLPHLLPVGDELACGRKFANRLKSSKLDKEAAKSFLDR